MQISLTEGFCGTDSVQARAQPSSQEAGTGPSLGPLNVNSLSRSVAYLFPITSKSCETNFSLVWGNVFACMSIFFFPYRPFSQVFQVP